MGRVINCGHRGAMDYEPENTLRSFARAADLGAEWIELDVRLTADDVVVLSHDATIKTEPEKAVIKEIDSARLKELKFRGEPVPPLRDVIELCLERKMGMNIEVKAPEATPGTVKLIEEYGLIGNCQISSFSHKALKMAYELNPKIPLGYLVMPVLQWFQRGRAMSVGSESINSLFKTTSKRYIDSVHARGMKANLWTVNEKEDIRRMIELGADMIITNRPEVCAEVKKELGVE